MAKVYFVRHQAAGILTDYPFASEPTAEQQEAVARLCFQRHGAVHPKSKEPYWLNVVALGVLGADDVPTVPERDLSVANAAGVDEFAVSGKGEVRNPKKP